MRSASEDFHLHHNHPSLWHPPPPPPHNTSALGFSVSPTSAVSQQSNAGARQPSNDSRLAFSPERLERIDSALARAVADGAMVGAVALVLHHGEPVYEKAFGWLDREAGVKMMPDAVFRIASQTKAVTSVALMMLAEEGRLSLNDPVSKFIPEFSRTSVALGTDSVAPTTRQIPLRDLLTHTSGISYGTQSNLAPLYERIGLGPAAGFGWYTADKDEEICSTVERLPQVPFVAQPGVRWVYGYSTDVLGCVVERVSGVGLDEFFRTRITGPLGMDDTSFFLPAEKRNRLAAVYTLDGGGTLVRAPEGQRGQGHYVEGARRSFSGGAGLLSTARDYGRFLQMMLNGGSLDGHRILGSKTVDFMTTNQVGSLHSPDGLGFSLGFQTVEVPAAGGRIQSEGSYGWSGAYGSTYLVDPKEDLILIFMTQEVPSRTLVSGRFPMLVYQAFVQQ